MEIMTILLHTLFMGILFFFGAKLIPFLSMSSKDRILNNKFHFYVSIINIASGGGMLLLKLDVIGWGLVFIGFIQAIFSQILLKKQ